MLSRSRSSRTTDLTVPYCLPPPLPTCLLPPTRPQAFRTTDLNFPDQTTRQSALGHDQPPRAQRQTKPGRRLPVQTGRHVFPTPSVPHDAPCWPYPFLSTRLLSPHPYSPNDWPFFSAHLEPNDMPSLAFPIPPERLSHPSYLVPIPTTSLLDPSLAVPAFHSTGRATTAHAQSLQPF